jgi:hypothetical protein
MIDFYVFLMSTALVAFVLFLLAPRSRWWRLAAVPLGMLALGLALRFCGRTYPGIYYPDYPILNNLLNGNGLFDIGVVLVLVLGVADFVFVFLTRFRQPTPAPIAYRALVTLRAGLLLLVCAIIAYGLFYATIFYEHWSQ